MKANYDRIIRSSLLSIILLQTVSCTKDTDLLADYLVSESIENRLVGNLVIGDNFVVTPQNSIVLDVLINDSFIYPDDVKIINVSQPQNGVVHINEDKTLTYYPDSSDAPISEPTETNQNSSSQAENEDILSSESQEAPENTEENQENVDEVSEEAENTPTNTESEENQKEQPKNQTEHESDENLSEETNDTTESEANTENEGKHSEDTQSENFTYTVETKDNEGNTVTEEGNVTVTMEMGSLKAFPGAMGFGRDTKGGRGGLVYHVTNLSNTGPGSLRYGLQKVKGPRTIVFDVSGHIDMAQSCSIRDPFVTIAGETAPEGGITIINGGLIVRTSEVIIRNLSIRPGINSAEGTDCIAVIASTENQIIENVIFDHLSLSWSRDENIGMNSSDGKNCSIRNLTVQNCIISEPLKNYGILVGRGIKDLSILRNLWANVPNRIPETTYGHTGESFEFINNIIYNYSRPTTIVHGTDVDVIGNVYKLGTKSPAQTNMRYQSGDYSPEPSDGNIYASDNIQEGKPNPLGFKGTTWKKWEKSSRIQTHSSYKEVSASELESKILSIIGNNHSYNSVDKRILREYENGTGIVGPKNESVVGGYPHMVSNSWESDYDTDRDGMPDDWEIANNLNPNDYNDGAIDVDGNGYTNLEKFLYSLSK